MFSSKHGKIKHTNDAVTIASPRYVTYLKLFSLAPLLSEVIPGRSLVLKSIFLFPKREK
jgi:hypothetical protein